VVLGISYAALRQRLTRARERLARRLSEQGVEPCSNSQEAAGRCK
jgi:hypothetical protein